MREKTAGEFRELDGEDHDSETLGHTEVDLPVPSACGLELVEGASSCSGCTTSSHGFVGADGDPNGDDSFTVDRTSDFDFFDTFLGVACKEHGSVGPR